jgi:hypothetical protein
VLDAIRAAQRLPEAHLPPAGRSPSPGTRRAAAPPRRQPNYSPSYAPELKLKGAYAGAVPADLAAVAHNLDGHYAAGFLGFALVSLDYAYPELNIPAILNAKGKQLFERVKNE